jgi:glucosamine-phosphate N-acetyltransferase
MTFVVKELSPELLVESSGLLETLTSMTAAPALREPAPKVLQRMLAQDAHVFVALTPDKEIIGTATVLIEQKFIHSGALVAHIEDVATRKGFERKGVATAVIRAALTLAKERACYKVILDCKAELIPFYEQFGFKDDVHHMRLDL